MSKIYHIAVKVPDIEKAKAFYKDLFGFEELKQSKVRDHTSCHLTDGVIDLAIVEYECMVPARTTRLRASPRSHTPRSPSR